MLPYNQAIGAAFHQRYPDVDVTIQAGGSYPALLALKRGAIDIAAVTDELARRDDDPKLRSYLIIKDAVAIIVNPKNSLNELPSRQVRDIFEGFTTNWGVVGGGDQTIDIIDRDATDPSDREELAQVVLGHRGAFKGVSKFVADDDGMRQAVAEDVDAIGYCGWEDLTPDVKALAIDGVPMTRESMLSGRYPYAWPCYLVTYGVETPAVRDFIAFARSDAMQAALAKNGVLRAY
jgi:phosphate transport system substrate-binding protein